MKNVTGYRPTALGLIVILLLGALALNPAAARIYHWVDDQGHTHFTDSPPQQGKSDRVSVRVNTYAAPTYESAPSEQAATDSKVILYGTTWCPHCAEARSYFRSHNIPFVEYDVEHSEKGKRDYARMGKVGVPVILIGQTRLVGFSAPRFQQAYDNR